MLFVLLLSFAYFAFQYNQYSKYLGMVPSELDVSYFFTFGTKELGACGAAIFVLSDKTHERILKDGLAFLKTANKTRRFYENRYSNKPLVQDSYDAWIKTDKSERQYWWSDAAFSGLYCYEASQVSDKVEEIRKHILEFGGYYTRIKYNNYHTGLDGSRLLIVPSMKIAVIEYWNL